MNLHEMTDEQLSDHLNAVLAEQERRERLRQIPVTVAMLAGQFRDGGGEQTELLAAIGG
ncbi:hypothetical protein KDJ04_gp03 [Arthrobacter phage Nubia]|uniref:Uncharacterized protein n=2 Tax=Korravirus TaxID=1982076 RepID=A0A0U4B3W9_9CAUD|nr:hypothetical protein FDH59_gp03 [Arthrobacter phage Joann]YP_010050294.1 hypothetical protein KDJ04_gp03 [Arthrobacter phage Nubia]ALY09406.1 hypothetical protein JOANN_3 [Arthrobacter phage Joann]ASR83737.1 hypothetical protein SEA_NUBIA_3 [Arthrobacter phage Nubia]